MATQKVKNVVKTVQYVKSGSTTIDRQGKKHCKTCGAYIGNRGRK